MANRDEPRRPGDPARGTSTCRQPAVPIAARATGSTTADAAAMCHCLEQLEALLIGVARHDPARIDSVARAPVGARLENGLFVFTLEGLRNLVPACRSLAYGDFRKRLFTSRLNERLGQSGLRVEVHRGTGKVDLNWYCLRPLPEHFDSHETIDAA